MKKNQTILFVSWAILLFWLTLQGFPFETQLRSLAQFTNHASGWGIFLFLLLFLIIIWMTNTPLTGKRAPDTAQLPVNLTGWWIGVLSIFLISIGLSIYVNPHARFSSHRYPTVTPSARLIKTELYTELAYSPDIVILGSSRAFSLSPDYIEEKLGYKTFNMSVEGGRLDDYRVEIQFLQEHTLPRVLIIEISPPILRGYIPNSAEDQPIALFPYSPLDILPYTLLGTVKDLLSFHSISDSVFLLSRSGFELASPAWSFSSTGEGLRTPITTEQYHNLIQQLVKTRTSTYSCNEIARPVQNIFNDMIRTAQEENTGVVLYMSPINKAAYNIYIQRDATGFSTCLDTVANYARSISNNHPNFFYQDLTYYPPISDLEENGFYDGVHLRPNAGRLVIDALSDSINKAYDWAISQ